LLFMKIPNDFSEFFFSKPKRSSHFPAINRGGPKELSMYCFYMEEGGSSYFSVFVIHFVNPL